MFLSGVDEVNIFPIERYGDSPVNRTPNLPIEKGTIRCRPNEMFVANAYVSGDVMMFRWRVAKESTIGEKRLSYPWIFDAISCRALFNRFSKEGAYKPRNNIPDQWCLLKTAIKSFLSFVLRTFDWDGTNGFVCRGRCRDWGAIAPQVSVLWKTWFHDKHRGTLAHWIWPIFLSKHFTNLLTPQPNVFFMLAYQSRASKHKNWKELDGLKLSLKEIKKS